MYFLIIVFWKMTNVQRRRMYKDDVCTKMTYVQRWRMYKDDVSRLYLQYYRIHDKMPIGSKTIFYETPCTWQLQCQTFKTIMKELAGNHSGLYMGYFSRYFTLNPAGVSNPHFLWTNWHQDSSPKLAISINRLQYVINHSRCISIWNTWVKYQFGIHE